MISKHLPIRDSILIPCKYNNIKRDIQDFSKNKLSII